MGEVGEIAADDGGDEARGEEGGDEEDARVVGEGRGEGEDVGA